MTAPTPAIRIGLLRLNDTAPVIVAHEKGLFRDLGLDVSISVEPSWSNIADKLSVGLLDAAVLLAPLALSVNLGLRGLATSLIVPMALSLNGYPITVTNGLAEEIRAKAGGTGALDIGRAFAGVLAEKRRGGDPLRFGIVHRFSTHNLLLRYWMAASGIDPERDIALPVIPPAIMVEALRAGAIVGFISGAPWGEIAERAGLGRTVLNGADVWHQHPEKVLGVRAGWAEQHPDALHMLLRALIRSCRFCDDPANAAEVAGIMAAPAYLGVEAAAIQAWLPRIEAGRRKHGGSMFFEHAATFPWRSHAGWFVGQLARWGYCAKDAATFDMATNSYQPNLYRLAAEAEGIAVPDLDAKPEGGHESDWMLEATPEPIAMQPDVFCDGKVY